MVLPCPVPLGHLSGSVGFTPRSPPWFCNTPKPGNANPCACASGSFWKSIPVPHFPSSFPFSSQETISWLLSAAQSPPLGAQVIVTPPTPGFLCRGPADGKASQDKSEEPDQGGTGLSPPPLREGSGREHCVGSVRPGSIRGRTTGFGCGTAVQPFPGPRYPYLCRG